MKHIRWWLTLAGFLAVVAIALAWRFYDIQDYPPGLFPDQAANGEDVRLILNGDVRPFYPRGNGREALFFFIQAAFVKLFGIGVWPMFAASALVGSATVVALYFATRPIFGRLAALLAAFFLATSYWQMTISRTGFRAIMIPLCVAAFTALAAYVVQAVKQKKIGLSYLYAALAGMAFSLGFYTYIAYRMMPAVVLAVFIILLLAALHPKIGFPHARRYGWQALSGLLAALITLLPMIGYFLYHPDAFIGRAGQVSIFSADLQRHYGGGTLLGTLQYSVTETLLSFFAGHGDLNWRHSVAGYPLLNPLVGFLFLLGFVWALVGCWRLFVRMIRGKEIHYTLAQAYVVMLWVAMLVPVVTTAEGMPHGLRSEGLVVPIFMLAGAAGAVIVHWVQRRWKSEPWRGIALGLVAGLLLIMALYDGALYFLVSRNSPDAFREYRGDLTAVAAFINQYRVAYPDKPRPYLVLDEFSVQTPHFLTGDIERGYDFTDKSDEPLLKYSLLDPATSHLTPLAADELIIFTQSTLPDADRYATKYSGFLEVVQQQKNRFGQEMMRVYTLRPGVVLPQAPNDEADLDA